MPRRRMARLRRVLAVVALVLCLPTSAPAQDGAVRSLPPGHPMVGDGVIPAGPLPQGSTPDEPDDDEAPLPPGHPSMPATRGSGQQGAAPGIFEPPPDTSTEDPSVPGGTISVEIRDSDNNSMSGVAVTLGILHQSVAKGESREHKMGTTDERGFTRFGGLETGSGVAYRVTVVRDGATFAATPFQLPEKKGMHVVLHVYAVTSDIQKALVVLQGITFVDVKDDRIQVEHVYTVFNLGKVTWLPDDVIIKLPPGFTALSSQQSMSDQGVDTVDRVGGRLRGTFPPGRHEIAFHWQLPYSGDKDVDFEVGLPPHVAVMQAMAAAQPGVKFTVVGFPDPEAKTNVQGQRVLVTEMQGRRDSPWTSLHIKLEGLPTPGPGRFIATGLSLSVVLAGFFFAFGEKPKTVKPEKSRRNVLLADLYELEKARATGDVGPKTYERTRRELIDEIARTLESGEKDDEPHRRRSR